MIIGACWTFPAHAKDELQNTGKPKREKLFGSHQTLNLALRAPWDDIVHNKNNPNPYPAKLEFTDSQGQAHSIPLCTGEFDMPVVILTGLSSS